MKQGKSLQELGRELQRQRNNRQDFLADTRSLEMTSTGRSSVLHLTLDNKAQEFGVGEVVHQQIASRLNIPYRYYQKMQIEAPDLLDQNVNRWLNQNPERRMIRVLDNNVRAFLSDRYRRLDNLELCAAVLPVIQEMKGASVESCEVTDSRMYLKVINKKLKAEVDVGDVVYAGFVISNSEVGLGSLRVEPLVFRLVCKNGLICKDYAQKRYHVGKQVNLSEDSAYEIYRDETIAQDDKAFFMKVQDVVRSAVDESKFLMTVGKLRESKEIPLKNQPVKEVELLADKFQLTENERGDILRQLFIGGDSSRYGLVNAVTAASKIAKSYDRATELERIGGEILSLPVPRNLLPPPDDFAFDSVSAYARHMKGVLRMSSYFHCVAYDDVKSKVRIEDGVIYLTIKDGNIDIHLTFNPLQVATLNKYLFATLDYVTIGDVANRDNFGNLTVEVENKNIDAENFKIPIGCCDNELVYDFAESA